MPTSPMLTVRIPAEELEKLDRIATIQGKSRFQLIQEALSELTARIEQMREQELARVKKRLSPAIKEQCAMPCTNSPFTKRGAIFVAPASDPADRLRL